MAWKQRQGTRIFLRDCLALSIALDQNFVDNQGHQYTELGGLEARAKERLDEDAVSRLVNCYAAAIRDLPRYRDARLIAAVPPRPGKTYDLPTTLGDRIAGELGWEDVTSGFAFANPKNAIKVLELAQKWDAWEAAGLTLSPDLEGSPSVVLIDDKYQSGITLQFVASRLYAACGVEALCGRRGGGVRIVCRQDAPRYR